MLGTKLGISSKQYNIETDGLILNYQPGFNRSYPGTGGNLFNLASGSLTPTGSLENDTTWTGASGNVGGYFTYDGTDDYVETGLSLTDLSITNKFTVDGWFYNDTLSAWDGLFGCASAGNFNDGFAAYINASGVLRFFVGIYSQTTNFVETTLPADTWHHIVCCYDGSLGSENVKLYVDGVAIANGVNGDRTGNVPDSGGKLRIATVNSTGAHYGMDGDIGPFLLYNRRLSPEEIVQNYNATKDRYTN